MSTHLFIAGIPATGKTWLGSWLAETRGYLHIDAERDSGADFDRLGVHAAWNQLITTGRGRSFVAALDRLSKPVIVNWGFPLDYLYVVTALQEAGIDAWWLGADRAQARAGFQKRGGIDVALFDRQMNDIEENWARLESVFRNRIVSGLRQDGSQRSPEELWAEINAG